ncbi:hypothetical protein NDU88_008118 [Pleurodeles waltl]|uniref:Uncharacterized protein n=1 Tax=Pleurodeles waltl TaxID=8319 RepID=A0AAV7N430_PLEWA|nr:hypothetical protein NDU88_008118 [Pleurodeles waltl]
MHKLCQWNSVKKTGGNGKPAKKDPASKGPLSGPPDRETQVRQNPQTKKMDGQRGRCQRKTPFRPHRQETEKREPWSQRPKRKDYSHFCHLLEQSRQEPLDQGNRGKGVKKTQRPRTGQGISPQCTQSEEPGGVEGKLGIPGGSKEIHCRNTPSIANQRKHRRNQNELQGGREHLTQEIRLMVQNTLNVNGLQPEEMKGVGDDAAGEEIEGIGPGAELAYVV